MSLYLTRAKFKNVRGFREVDLSFVVRGKPRPWTVVIGNNGHGKSTLLRGIALGLADEETASGLLAKLSGDFIRQNKRGNPEELATIELEFRTAGKTSEFFWLNTRISRNKSGLIVRKEACAALCL